MTDTEAEKHCQDALKPCPFCGSEPESFAYSSCDCCGKPVNAGVYCTQCPATVDHLDTAEEAIALWNARHESTHRPDLQALRESLEAMAVSPTTRRKRRWVPLDDVLALLTAPPHISAEYPETLVDQSGNGYHMTTAGDASADPAMTYEHLRKAMRQYAWVRLNGDGTYRVVIGVDGAGSIVATNMTQNQAEAQAEACAGWLANIYRHYRTEGQISVSTIPTAGDAGGE